MPDYDYSVLYELMLQQLWIGLWEWGLVMELYELTIENLYQAFGSGLILGFSLGLICLLILSGVFLLKGLFKESIEK